MKLFGFVVETDSYTGNFEREMCAYMTGRVGECEVGNEFVEEHIKNKFNNVVDIPDDNGCYRPVSVLSGDEQFNVNIENASNALVIYFSSKPTTDQVVLLKQRALEFPEVYMMDQQQYSWGKNAKFIEVKGFMLVENQTKTALTVL